MFCLIRTDPAAAVATGIYVEYYSVNNPGDGWVPHPSYPANFRLGQPGLASGSDVSINNANSLSYRVFTVNPSQTDIGSVYISASSANMQPNLLIGSGFTIPLSSARLPTMGCRTLGSISYGTGKPRVQAWVITVTQGIDAWEVVRVDLSGDLTSAITQQGDETTTLQPTLGRVQAASIGSTGSVVAYRGAINTVSISGDIAGPITAAQGSISFIETTNSGRLLANVTAPSGTIDQVLIDGDIGTATSPRSITAKTGIASLQARNIYASVTASANGGKGKLKLLRTTNNGHFIGNILCSYIGDTDIYDPHSPNYGVYITGRLDGTLRAVYNAAAVAPADTGNIRQDVVIGQSSPSGSIVIDRALISYADIHIKNGTMADDGTIGTVQIGLGPDGGGINGNISFGTFLDRFEVGPAGSAGNIVMNQALALEKTLRMRGPLTGFPRLPPLEPVTACIDILQAGGLGGQVLVNTDQIITPGWGTGSDTQGLVRVGPESSRIVLNNSLYTVPSSSLGGGAVGVAPYTLYGADCSPPQLPASPPQDILGPASCLNYPTAVFRSMEAFAAAGTSNTDPIRVRHYGPVRANEAGKLPVAIEYWMMNAWQHLEMSFDVTVGQSEGTAGREVALRSARSAAFLFPGLYRVRPVINPASEQAIGGINWTKLVCAGTTAATPPTVVPYEYYFVLLSDCNGDGSVGCADIVSYFSKDCNMNNIADCIDVHNGILHEINGRITECAGDCELADFNADGEANGNDISDYINAWYGDIISGTVLGDVNHDGETNGNDISDFINIWYNAITGGC